MIAVVFDNTFAETKPKTVKQIPTWVKESALSFGQGKISEAEYLKSVQFLADNGYLKISKEKTTSTTPKSTESTIKASNNDSKFDSKVVSASKKNIPKMQELPKAFLKQCKLVKSYSDYLVFAAAITATQGSWEKVLQDSNVALTILELNEYDKHSEVGPLIKETRKLYADAGNCITSLVDKYGD